MISAALGFAGVGAVLAWALALVARADRGFHSPGPVALPSHLPDSPLELLRAHAREANLCDSCRVALWDYRTSEDEYLCRLCACPCAEMSSARPGAD